MKPKRRRLRRQQRRQVYQATIRACRESASQEEAIQRAEVICRTEFMFIETILISLAIKAILYLVPIIWNWIRGNKTDAEIELMLEADKTLMAMFADESNGEVGS